MTCFPLLVTQTQFGQALQAILPVTYTNPKTGHILNANAEFDSGATISLAPQSLATILGLDLLSGTPLQLSGVTGGTAFQAFVHSLDIQIGDRIYRGVLIAIVAAENVPFLLGRTNLWDFISARIDDVNRQICIDSIMGEPAPVEQVSLAGVGVIFLGIGAAAALVAYLLVRT